LLAFENMPKVEVPAKKGGCLSCARTRATARRRTKKKIEMFNTGEIAVFRRTGLTPVFFGETLIGSNTPNLTYMLVFENMAEHDKNWGQFGSDPEWKKLSTTPDIRMSKLSPTSAISFCGLQPIRRSSGCAFAP